MWILGLKGLKKIQGVSVHTCVSEIMSIILYKKKICAILSHYLSHSIHKGDSNIYCMGSVFANSKGYSVCLFVFS